MAMGQNDSQKKTSILVVDDDPFVRASLLTILSAQEDFIISGEGGNGLEAKNLFEELKPDILLMDIQMPECGGIEAAEAIIALHPEAYIVFLTTFSDDEYIVSALRLGARGYLIKQEVAQIAPALRAVMAGQMVLGGEAMGKVDSLMKPAAAGQAADEAKHDRARKNGLTDREFEIIKLIAQGHDNKEIAHAIFISEGTVRNHVSVILQKLLLKNRTQLAVYYYQHLS